MAVLPATSLGSFFKADFLRSSMHKIRSSGFLVGIGTGLPPILTSL